MFMVLLRFTGDRAQIGPHMEGHNQWIRQGLEDEVFLVVGSLEPKRGGAILARNTTRDALDARIERDPFVAARLVTPEVIEFTPSKVAPRLDFLLSDR